MWTLIAEGGNGYNHSNHYQWLIDSADDLNAADKPKDTGAPGSIAYTAGFEQMWQKNRAGQWIEIGGNG